MGSLGFVSIFKSRSVVVYIFWLVVVFNVLTLSDGGGVVNLNFLRPVDEGGLVVFNFQSLADGGVVVVFNFLMLTAGGEWVGKNLNIFADIINEQPL